MDNKSRVILKAIAAGRSLEQILDGNGAVTQHDIFRAITEAPTRFWNRTPANRTPEEAVGGTTPVQGIVKQRRD